MHAVLDSPPIHLYHTRSIPAKLLLRGPIKTWHNLPQIQTQTNLHHTPFLRAVLFLPEKMATKYSPVRRPQRNVKPKQKKMKACVASAEEISKTEGVSELLSWYCMDATRPEVLDELGLSSVTVVFLYAYPTLLAQLEVRTAQDISGQLGPWYIVSSLLSGVIALSTL